MSGTSSPQAAMRLEIERYRSQAIEASDVLLARRLRNIDDAVASGLIDVATARWCVDALRSQL